MPRFNPPNVSDTLAGQANPIQGFFNFLNQSLEAKRQRERQAAEDALRQRAAARQEQVAEAQAGYYDARSEAERVQAEQSAKDDEVTVLSDMDTQQLGLSPNAVGMAVTRKQLREFQQKKVEQQLKPEENVSVWDAETGSLKYVPKSQETQFAPAAQGTIIETKRAAEAARKEASDQRAADKADAAAAKASDKAEAEAKSLDDNVDALKNGTPASQIPPSQRAAAVRAAREIGIPIYDTPEHKVKVTTLNGIRKDAARMAELMKDPEVRKLFGPLAGKLTENTANWRNLTPAQREAYSLALDLTDKRLRERSGAAVTIQESGRIQQFSAGLGISPDQVITNMGRLTSEIDGLVGSLSGGSASGSARKATHRWTPNGLVAVTE